MLDYRLINFKPEITYNGETYKDLLSEIFNDKHTFSTKIIIVNKYYVARPDLISLAIYGDDKYADIICKINGISNPFELNEDDLLILPNVEFLQECLKKTRVPSQLITDPKTDKIQKKDTYNKQKRKDELRSPNEQLIGDSNYIIDKSLGLVFY